MENKSSNSSTIRSISRRLLIVEVTLLAIPSLLLLLMCLEGFSYLTFNIREQRYFEIFAPPSGILIIVSGWRIIYSILSEDIIRGVKINIFWWVLAGFGVPFSIFILFFVLVVSENFYQALTGFLMSGLFSVTYFHLRFEEERQKKLASIQ